MVEKKKSIFRATRKYPTVLNRSYTLPAARITRSQLQALRDVSQYAIMQPQEINEWKGVMRLGWYFDRGETTFYLTADYDGNLIWSYWMDKGRDRKIEVVSPDDVYRAYCYVKLEEKVKKERGESNEE